MGASSGLNRVTLRSAPDVSRHALSTWRYIGTRTVDFTSNTNIYTNQEYLVRVGTDRSYCANLRSTCCGVTRLANAALTCLQVHAMKLGSLEDEMPQLLIDMGLRYDPMRLAATLGKDPIGLNLRALRIASTLGGFVTSLLKVRYGQTVEKSLLFC